MGGLGHNNELTCAFCSEKDNSLGMPANLLSILTLLLFNNHNHCSAEAGCGGERILDTGRNGCGSEEERWDCIQKAV